MNRKLRKAKLYLNTNSDTWLKHFSVNPDNTEIAEIDGEVCQHTGDVTAWINYDVTGNMAHVDIIEGYDQFKRWFEQNTPYELKNADVNPEHKQIHICIIAG